jgi:hypothetical protein
MRKLEQELELEDMLDSEEEVPIPLFMKRLEGGVGIDDSDRGVMNISHADFQKDNLAKVNRSIDSIEALENELLGIKADNRFGNVMNETVGGF